MNRHIKVVGAVIEHEGLILCAQRGGAGELAGFWEFPGGKVETGETPRDALEREILEELECDVHVGEEVAVTAYDYHFATVELTTFHCTLRTGSPKLTEHVAIRWLAAPDLAGLTWAPADLPTVAILMGSQRTP